MRQDRLRTLWKADKAAVNGWLVIPNSFSAEVMAQHGSGCSQRVRCSCSSAWREAPAAARRATRIPSCR
jgi:hypothetical protein